MKKIIGFGLVMFLFLGLTSPVLAAPAVSVRLLKKQNVVIAFTGIKNLKSVSYELLYINNGKEEGAVGTIKPKKDTDSRTLYLGTCSKKVCTPHRKISSGKVQIKFKTKTGVTTVKNFNLKF